MSILNPSGGGSGGGVTMDQVNEAIQAALDERAPVSEIWPDTNGEEIVVGTYGGKPLYRKRYSGRIGASASGTSPTISVDATMWIRNVHFLTHFNSYGLNAEEYGSFYYGANDWLSFSWYNQGVSASGHPAGVYVQHYSHSEDDYIAWIDYTKPTD